MEEDLGVWLDRRLDEEEEREFLHEGHRINQYLAFREREQERASRLRRQYGITPEEWDELLAAQDGKCAICEEPMERPFVDHDHETGEVRGLLCNGCNAGLGLLGDSAEGLERALAYLTK